MDIDEDTSKKVQVKFVTKLKPPYKAPEISIALPSNLTRMGLSAVVNNLLESGNDDWKHEPFDFLIGGEFVRMSLGDFLIAKGITAEITLEIEYVRAVAPRKEEDPSLHDDWVSAVDGSSRLILTGCYDGLGRIWESAGVCTHVLEGHNDAITSVGIVKAIEDEDNTVATGSKDKTVKLWKVYAEPRAEKLKIAAYRTLRGHTASVQSVAAQPTANMVCSGSWDCRINLWQTESNEGEDTVSTKKRKKGSKEEETQSEGHNDAITSVGIVKAIEDEDNTVATGSKDKTVKLWKVYAEPRAEKLKIAAYRTLRGHTASVQSVAAQPTANMVCSGSWDCRINLWQTESNEGEDTVSTKKRKKGSKEEETQSEGEAVSTLVGHTQCVSSVVWPEHGTIYSGSWDHSIRRWDVETGKDTLNMFCGKVINCIDVGGESSALIAAGGSDPILRIWDPRKPGTLAPSFQFSSHTSWITACKWHSRSWFHLLSSSYDGKVMLWDLRTAWPLAIIDSHEDKVLCADWWNGESVVSGGADSKLRISSEVCIS